MNDNKLSLPSAILINLNIMLGAGIFINTVELAKRAGALSSLAYPLIGLLMLPLIISIAKLVNIFPDAGFYGYGSRAMHPFVGFISAWSYFTGKLASAMLMIHVALSLVQQTIPFLHGVPIMALDAGVVIFFIALNMLNVQTGSTIQVWFMALKIIPIFFAIFTGLYFFSWRNFTSQPLYWPGIPSTLPLVLYAATGFEAACSLSCKIRNAQRNGPRAIFISYAIMLCIAFIYQFTFYGAVGSQLNALENYKGIFPLLLSYILPAQAAINGALQAILYLAIAASALGSGYGILFSNTWNLYALASYGHTFCARTLTKLNRFGLPTYCIMIEGVICLSYLLITYGSQVPLQLTSAMACTIAYTISVLSLVVLAARRHQSAGALWIPLLALINCLFLIVRCVQNFVNAGNDPLLFFLCLFALGIIMFVWTSRHSNNKTMQAPDSTTAG